MMIGDGGIPVIETRRIWKVRALSGRVLSAISKWQALNYQIQGSCADLILKATARLPEPARSCLINIIHDELLFEVPADQAEMVRLQAIDAMTAAGDAMLGAYGLPIGIEAENQGKSGLGLQAQQEAVQRFLKEGDSIAAEFREIESGKRHQNRPQLAAALDYCRLRGCVLLIATLDRLARNVHFISGLMETNVPFLAADRPTASAFEIHIFAAMAEEERRKISQRVKAALAVKRATLAKEGKKLGNPRPLEALKLAVAAKRQALSTTPEVLKLITDRHREQKSLRTIANELNRLGIRTGRGKRWYASSVRLQIERVRRMPREEPPSEPAGEQAAVTPPTDQRQPSAPPPPPEPPQRTLPPGPDGVPMTPLEAAASIARRLAQHKNIG